MKEGVVHNLITLISNAEELQPYAVRRLYAALVEALASSSRGEASVLYAAAWCIGEYGEMLPTGAPWEGGYRGRQGSWCKGSGGGSGSACSRAAVGEGISTEQEGAGSVCNR